MCFSEAENRSHFSRAHSLPPVPPEEKHCPDDALALGLGPLQGSADVKAPSQQIFENLPPVSRH